jgi:uncharacterized membrane protein
MNRRALSASRVSGEDGFRWRGHEVSRLEGFSDAVFAFAVTLLVVSLEVPKTYAELIEAMSGFGVFGICFSLLAYVWYEHYRYFRRYGLETPWAVALNCALLFCVLFYVYPLKFLFSAALGRWQFPEHEARTIFSTYDAGFSVVFGVLFLLYLYAWHLREDLELTARERVRTLHSLTNQAIMVLLGLMLILGAQFLPARLVGMTGLFYTAIPLLYWLSGWFWGRRERVHRRAPSGAGHS